MAYQAAISNAAFFLGYAYLESFLADILKEVYLRRPEILPREKQLKYEEIISTASREDLINLMIAKEVRSVLGTSIEDVKEHFERRLSVPWPDQPKILIASKIRNCLMHNGARVDQRLAAANESFVLDSIVSLQIGDVHEYGLAARYFADEL